MRGPRRRSVVAIVAAVILIGAIAATAMIMYSASEYAVPAAAYRPSGDGRVLVVRVEVHPDHIIVRADADEETEQVVVWVSARPPSLWWSGGDYAVAQEVEIHLDRPLDARQVVDGRTGRPLPRG